jgi:hypothetical protein
VKFLFLKNFKKRNKKKYLEPAPLQSCPAAPWSRGRPPF